MKGAIGTLLNHLIHSNVTHKSAHLTSSRKVEECSPWSLVDDEFEVIVVDDNSPDGTQDVVKAGRLLSTTSSSRCSHLHTTLPSSPSRRGAPFIIHGLSAPRAP